MTGTSTRLSRRASDRPSLIGDLYPVILRLVFGFDMDRHAGIGNLGDDRGFHAVADLMGVVHAHLARHDEVELHEGRLSRVPRPEVVGFDGAGGLR